MTFRAVLFDLGGVVFDSPMDGFARYEERAGLPPGLIRRLNSTNPDANAWARMERGEVGPDGFAELFEAEARAEGFEVDARQILAGLSGAVRPVMIEALRRLRAGGLRLAAGTNNISPMAGTDRAELLLLVGLFDVFVESSVESVRKPEAAFYERVLARLGVPATEVVFLDDLGVNLKPARAMGMTTIKVIEPEAALAELGDHVGIDLLRAPDRQVG